MSKIILAKTLARRFLYPLTLPLNPALLPTLNPPPPPRGGLQSVGGTIARPTPGGGERSNSLPSQTRACGPTSNRTRHSVHAGSHFHCTLQMPHSQYSVWTPWITRCCCFPRQSRVTPRYSLRVYLSRQLPVRREKRSYRREL